MADNLTSNPGSGGAVFATDEINNIHFPRTKLSIGADGSAADLAFGQAAMASSLPVVLSSDQAAIPITDNGGSLTVDGTVAVTGVSTAANQATEIAILAILAGAVTAAKVQVDVISAPTLTVNSHAVTNAGTFATQAAQSGTWNIGTVATLTNALPAGTNAIGKLAANSGVDIGDVDVTSVPADPFGVNADAASATGSISAKLRFIAGTGIPITGTVTVGSHAVTNAGTFVVQENGAALTSLQLIDDVILTDDAAFTPATSKVAMAGFQADETSTDSVDEGDAGAARMTLDRKLITAPQPHSKGGLSIFRTLSLINSTLQVIKNSPGCVYGMWVTNKATTVRYIKFYDATSGTAGTGTPVITIGIPGNSTDNIAGNFGPGGMGIGFTTGICIGATTGLADNDTGAPSANDCICNVFYA